MTILLVTACRGEAQQKSDQAAPVWLGQLIETAQQEPVTNPPVVFLSFRYRDRSVVYRPPYCCDIQGVVYDDTGARLCHPDGGFTGNGDGRCPDFAQAATECTVLWRDPRATKNGRDLCARRDAASSPLE